MLNVRHSSAAEFWAPHKLSSQYVHSSAEICITASTAIYAVPTNIIIPAAEFENPEHSQLSS